MADDRGEAAIHTAHRIEIITELAKLIEAKVDLEKPDKILRIDLIGKYAGLAVLRPVDVFSVAKP